MKKIYLFILSALLLSINGISQAVTVTNPGNTTPVLAATYTSLALAITDLSGITAITGPVVISLNAGNAETAPAGGYVIQFNAITSAASTITITGNNNIITAFSPQAAGSLNDALFKLIGTDYVTIQNFTMQENAANTINTPAVSNNMTEWGVALLRASAIDGAQHNTILNNTISLNKTYRNSFGIYSNARHIATDPITVDDATAFSGSNSGNKIYGNSITNVMMGITFIGTATAAFQDADNDIGGSSAATGNTITNWGGNTPLSLYASNPSTAVSYCIFINHQVGENVSYNTINSGTVGAGVSATFSGIRKEYSVTAPVGTFTSTISFNTITMSSAFTGGNFECIRSQGMTALSTATINITNNNLLNNSITGIGTSSAFGGIINASAPGTLNITNNIMRGLVTVSSGGFTGISNSGAVVNTINITGNKIGDAIAPAATYSLASASQINCITNSGGSATLTNNINNNSIDGFSVVRFGQVTAVLNTAAAATLNMNNNQLGSVTGNLISFSGVQTTDLFLIYTQSTGAASTVNIQGNNIQGIVHSVTATCNYQYITTATAVASADMSNNTFTNIIANTSGNIFFMTRAGDMASGNSFTCTGNSIVTGYNKTGAGGQVAFLSSQSASVNGSTLTVTGNNFSNITLTGAATLFPFLLIEGVSNASGPAKIVTGNTISNITGGSGQQVMFWLDKSGPITCSSNTISNITGSGTIYAIYFAGSNGPGTHACASNTISSLTSTGTGGDVEAIIGGNSVMTTFNINNNSITALSSTGTNARVAGIEVDAGITVNANDNLVNNINGSGAGSPFAAGLIVFGGTTVNVYKNKINTISQTGAITGTGTFLDGIFLAGGANVTAYNNFISDLNIPNSNSTRAMAGIEIGSVTALSTYNLYYNSIYLNANSVAANFGSYAVYARTNNLATTASLNMIDNIFVNTSTPTGSGVAAAYGRTSTTLNNYAASADYNLFYAGTPSATRLIFYDGTNSDITLAAYQSRVSTRDANSISVMPDFTSATDLHLTTANCWIDGRGTPIAITTDIDNATRDIATPDMGADEFTSVISTTLAGIVGSAICEDKIVSVTGTTYTTNACELIARVQPAGANPVAGNINACVTLDGSQLYFNGEPYVQRHYDIEPFTSNTSTTSATITLYFNDAEFALYNFNNPGWPKLPTVGGGGIGDLNLPNIKITQFHGTPTGGLPTSTPGNYTGTRLLLTPLGVVLNGTIWEVTFDITGFSGFYVHTNIYNVPLPISINYFTGSKQGSNHLLNWKVTCNATPKATMVLERSGDSRNFSGINTIVADAARCDQPFNYTDVQPLKGMNYYRLKMIDADVKITYSSIVALLNEVKGFDIISIAPNPVVTDNFKLNVASAQAGKMEIIIFDMQGRLMKKQTISLIAGFNSLPVNVGNLAAGTYQIRAGMGNERSGVVRFVKQ